MEENEDTHAPKICISQKAMSALYEMRTNNLLCDATIRLDNEHTFNIHRAIMCSSSNFFRALFTTSLTGVKDDVSIPGIRREVMEKIIDYAYLRKSSVNENNVFEILVASDYIGLLGLLKICIVFMIRMMNSENCIRIMMFARARNCQELFVASRYFVLQNFIKVAAKSRDLFVIGLNDFYDIISDDMLNTKAEEPVWECCIRWIDFDPSNRCKHIAHLMRGVRLGLIDPKYFVENVKDHPYVIGSDSTRSLVIETLKFVYDLDMIASRDVEIRTPALAIPRFPHEVIFAIGGWSDGLPQSCIETYDTRADRWVRIHDEDPAGPRAYHGTAVIGANIYSIGGFDGIDYFNTCRLFDAIAKTWKEIAPMHYRRCYVSVTQLDGLIYAMGGYDGHHRQNTAESYDPKTNQWSLIPTMQAMRSDASACTLNGKIYITGGFNGQECLSSVECYDPESKSWSATTPMLSRRSGVSCVSYRGSIYVVGGFNGLSRMKTAERYDAETGQWYTIQEMYHPRSNFGLEIIDDMIFAMGGFNGAATISHTECYVVETNEWLEATDMSVVRSALSASVIVDIPNIRDYIHKDRDRLIEERRQRMFGIDATIEEQDENNRPERDQQHHIRMPNSVNYRELPQRPNYNSSRIIIVRNNRSSGGAAPRRRP